MAELFSSLLFWHWFAFGGILLLLEMVAPGAIFLWPGFAAIAIGLLTFVMPTLPWTLVVPLWAILSVMTAFGWRAYRIKNPVPVDPVASTLNQRGTQYIGRQFTLAKPIVNGIGEVKVDDTIWKVVSDTDLMIGSTVRVTAVEGTSLRVTTP